MRHVGILAHSADGAALCFLEMVREASQELGAHAHPEITLSILPMGPILECYARNELVAVREYLARTASRLAAAGCDFFVCPNVSPLPILDSTRLLAQAAVATAVAGALPTWRGGLVS